MTQKMKGSIPFNHNNLHDVDNSSHGITFSNCISFYFNW
jgi:hypothetical protein